MSRGISVGWTPTTRRGFTLFWATLFAISLLLQYASFVAPSGVDALSGAIYTSNIDGTIINENVGYPSKADVYLTGGPCQGGSHLADGAYYFQVTIPTGNGDLLSTDSVSARKFTVTNGFITSASGHLTNPLGCAGVTGETVQLLPYLDTTNSGGEYKLTVATASTVEACNDFTTATGWTFCNGADSKSDNYKVLKSFGTLQITKVVSGDTSNWPGGTFAFHADCGTIGGAFDASIVLAAGVTTGPTSEAVVDGASCTVTETGTPTETNYQWGTPTIAPSGAVSITNGHTSTVTVTNPRSAKPAPALSISKGVSLTDGSYGASVTTTVGTTVHYQIVVTNTGNVGLTGVTLADSLTDLSTKTGCTIPTTLAVGATFTCKYTGTAIVGTTVNTATADSAETAPVTASATVNVASAPALSISKGVSLTDGSYGASVTTTVGTTVHYQIVVTNTGNVGLTGVTLADSLTDLSTKTGCTIPTTLAVGATFTCKYTGTAIVGTTVNTATADSAETAPVTASATVNVASAPGLNLTKGVSLTNGAGYVASLTTTVGTTVYYRIHVSNTGNVGLSGVQLIDSLFSLSGCTIPTTLAVGGSFDCSYSDTAKAGTTTNVATASAAGVQPVNASATVIGTTTPPPPPPPPAGPTYALAITKGVSLTSGSGYVPSLTTTAGTTVYYRITVTNNSSVGLTGVTLADTKFSVASCSIPATLNAGASFSCDYSATAVEGTTVNTATASNALTGSVSASATVIAPAPSPTGSVAGITSPPKPTLPPTDTLGRTGSSNPGSNFGLLLVLFAGLMTTLGLLTPVRVTNRRDRRG